MENKSKLEPSESGNGKSKCPICKEDATLVCSGCQSVSYCSVDHQKKHWKLHQSSCVFFHIKDDPSEFTGAAKFCVASRDLKAGTLILEELPELQMPSNCLDRCITCGINLPPKSERNASRAENSAAFSFYYESIWSKMCSALKFSLHAADECQVFVANRIPYPKIIADSPLFELSLYPALMRGYAVMVQDPQQWNKMKKMLESSHVKSGRIVVLNGSIHYPVKLEKIASASSHFPTITKEDENLVMGILSKLMRLTLTQGHSILIQEGSTASGLYDRHRAAAYVYKTARHFVHSCSPNCFWTVGTFPDFKMQIRTSVPVKKGEKLTASRFIYKDDFANGTRNRQKRFRFHFHFPCRCDMCLDPTEFGTFQSAVVCAACKTGSDVNSKPGYLLPIDPLNIADDAPWKCNSCKKMTTASTFCGKVDELSLDLQEKCSAKAVSCNKVCEAFIDMYRNKLVHPNHWLIQLAGKLIRINQIPCMTAPMYLRNTEELSEFEKLMHFLVDLKDKTLPGIIHERSVLVQDLGGAMCRRLHSLFAQEEFYKGFLGKSREDLLRIVVDVEKCQEYQKESLVFQKHNPNIGRGQTVDPQLTALRANMKSMEELKTIVLTRIAQI